MSCLGAACWAVGGQNTGVVLRGETVTLPDTTSGFRWQPRDFTEARGWNGVWFADATNTFVVGVNGQTMHTNGFQSFMARSLTPATLHGVGGWVRPDGSSTVVLAVGGELDTADATQRAVILVRGDDSAALQRRRAEAFVPSGSCAARSADPGSRVGPPRVALAAPLRGALGRPIGRRRPGLGRARGAPADPRRRRRARAGQGEASPLPGHSARRWPR